MEDIKMRWENEPRPVHKYDRGDLVTIAGVGIMVIWGRDGIVREGLGPWTCRYIVCPLRADLKAPDLRSWNAQYIYSGKMKKVKETELLLTKSNWYVE